MTRRLGYVCNPGTSHLTEEQAAEKCKCGHERIEHWWGGGDRADCARCTHFRPRKAASE